MTDPWQEPVRGGYPDPTLFGLSGFEQLQGFFKGWGPRPPISHLMGHMLTDVGTDVITFTQAASPWLQVPPGHISLGVLAALADAPLGCAVQAGLPPFTAYTTAELSMNYVRPPAIDWSDLRATGSRIHGGRSLALTDVVIEDSAGRLIAHGTSRCVVFEPMGPPPEDTPDPYLRRDVKGFLVPQDMWDEHSGLEILRMLVEGVVDAPPISHLTGMLVTEAAEGTTTFTMPAHEHLCSPLKTIQGGTIAMLADHAMLCAVQTTGGPRTVYFPVDLKVNFLRPTFPDGNLLTARATILHRGKSVAVAQAEVTNAEGKRVALAMGTSLIRENAEWHPGAAPDDVPQKVVAR
ncbi:MAG: PaaI family thioesterase [Actinobacteria bacterium]|nr:PaaI family thioesterase [Actinomycetota bacterium]